ncbi:MAG: hypothetical protein COT73_01685 [Bdellovibrio sp. CG10_big_fil_rev_8_21_14_0_10_47_8]|nr:MAG: hypothetical protein COT73_01685 [Bdellovibrio sp. CG10_big_fil_rev_8_21_14_0_10_47_8]
MKAQSFKKIFFLTIFLSSLILTSAQSEALTRPVQDLVDFETKANGAGVRNNTAIDMPHYEIPLRLLTESKEFNLSLATYKALVFQKNGEDYVRWVINPEDSKWYKDVEKFMTDHGLTPEQKTYFKGYQTASRSYIVEDPSGKVQFSIKASTDRTGGAWRDKKQEYQDGFDIRLISDLMTRVQAANSFENIVVMEEPLTFGIKEIDQSIVVRELADISRSQGVIYLPGFSALHETKGKEIAALNGSNDPYAFWTEHYVKPMAKAAAELASKTGIWYDSPHSQNFLIELNSAYKPTGRIVIRDLGDVYVSSPLMKALGEGKLLAEFSASAPGNVHSSLDISFGPLHGNKAPSWISAEQYSLWENIFVKTMSTELSRRTKISAEKLNVSSGITPFSYISSTMSLKSPEWQNFMQTMPKAPKFCGKVHQL